MLFWSLLVCIVVLLGVEPANAYIGPGAGIAVGGSFLAVFAAVFSAFVMVLSWPIRFFWRLAFRRRPPRPPRFKRVVVLGLDGLDFGLTQQMLAEGKLPHLAALKEQGCMRPLRSTLPPISPVAWSTFQTGTNPGKHNIFDFLIPDQHTYQPKLSSVEVRPPRRALRLGKYRIPLGKPDVRLLRKSKPFWSVLSDYGIFSCILRVPITFPPERFRGVQLSAMCVPDLRGTQGTFSLFTTRPQSGTKKTGGEVQRVARQGNTIRAALLGPDNPLCSELGPLKVPFTVALRDANRAVLSIQGSRHELRKGQYTEWIKVKFRVMPGVRAVGVCRFLLLQTEPEFELYVTPVNIDPEKPALPIAHPPVYSTYLANRQGPFATLGLAEDTWGLNELVLDDEHFQQQCLDIDREREVMFFDGLDKVPRGLCVCVFDGSDRMQHMFWRYHDDQHPARPAQMPNWVARPEVATSACQHFPSPPVLGGRGVEVRGAEASAAQPPRARPLSPEYRGEERTEATPFGVPQGVPPDPIEALYRRMDDLVGRTVARCAGSDTLLMVLSDHGFTTFRRGIDLNRWLEENGYLVVDDARRNEDYLAGVDWSRTQAFAIGLTGIFINTKDKFASGIVAPEKTETLCIEIAEKLSTLIDPESMRRAIRRIYQADKAYRGPYKGQAPDLIVGYEASYRVSWDAAIGRTTTAVFHTNTKAWSGDHCVDPSVVPGVLFCNQPFHSDNPRLLDIAPTVLDLFGVPAPDFMDGQALTIGGAIEKEKVPALQTVGH